MPPLSNPKWEAFAQGLAKGIAQGEAYAQAGYKPNDPNASRLIKNDKIVARVAEMQERAANRTQITLAKLTDMLLEDRQDARTAGQYAAAISADEKLGKLYGLFIDRSINETVHYVVRAPEPAKTIEGWLEGRQPKHINGGEE